MKTDHQKYFVEPRQVNLPIHNPFPSQDDPNAGDEVLDKALLRHCRAAGHAADGRYQPANVGQKSIA